MILSCDVSLGKMTISSFFDHSLSLFLAVLLPAAYDYKTTAEGMYVVLRAKNI